MDIRAILIDFDGTLLQRDQIYLSLRNKKALEAAMDRGIEVIPSTGRVEDMFPPQIAAEPRIRYWVTSNGARVVDRRTGEILHQSLFTPEESAELCRIFENRRIYSEISANGLVYMEKEVCGHLEDYPVPPHHVWFLETGRQVCLEKPSDFFLQNRMGIEKINIYGVPEGEQRDMIDALDRTGCANITEGAGRDIQFFPKRQDRNKAIEALLSRLNLRYENVMSLGDSALDASVIERSGIGVAMANAPEWVKAQAAYVTAPYYEDGVAQAIEKFLL